MNNKVILKCPKCGKEQEVSLKDIQNNIQFNGHWWSCPNDCKWDDDEYEKRHSVNDIHVYLEIVNIIKE